MCGITGIVGEAGSVAADALEAATRKLIHRGPDSQHWWVDERRQVGLGSARLSIIDLDGGDQPIANEDGSILAVVNGELYDFEAIRRRLEGAGHRFRTGSDSEILLHLYEDHGVGCLRHLRGEFAFLLWDGRTERLFAGRDRFGIKPLYYSRHGGALYLASEVKALFAAGVPSCWDPETYFQQLFVGPAPDRTLFGGVRQLPPSHYLIADAGGVEVTRYWDLDYPRLEAAADSANEATSIAEIRTLLDEAVRIRLRADVPVGCFLSGGLDSSAVIGLAARHRADPIRAFTVTFPGSPYDEAAIARETAAAVGADFHPLPIDQGRFADSLRDAVLHAETLGVNPHGIARYLQSAQVRSQKYKVVLSGEGSDEIFAGYGSARQDFLLDRSTSTTPRGVPGALAEVQRRLGFVPAWMRSLALSRAVFHALLAADFAQAFRSRDPYSAFLDDFDLEGQLAGRDRVLQSMYLWSRSILPNYILFAERLEMAHSLEVRLPFLDHHLVERARHLPVEMLIRGRMEKYVLRQAVREVLTETVYTRHKHPFTAPPATGNQDRRLFELMEEHLRGPSLARVPFFDQAAVISLLEQLPRLEEETRVALDAALLMVLCTCLLQEGYDL